jgi:hypothetical protein
MQVHVRRVRPRFRITTPLGSQGKIMVLPTDLTSWLNILGAVSTSLGSVILAWRAKVILTWVKYSLVAHEITIQQLIRKANREHQTMPAIEGSVSQLLKIEDKLGVVLLVIGFLLLALGMLLKAVSYFFV